MPAKTGGSRLSGQTKRAIKNSGLSKEKKQALRAELRTPGVSAREKKLTGVASGRNSATMNAFTSQAGRSKRRAAANKNGNMGGRTGGRKRV
jgi:hypothetical protein